MTCDVAKCHAQCCGLTPIPAATYHQYKHLITREIRYQEDLGEAIVAADKDGVCGFLGGDKRCMIYNYRPEVCRIFGETDKTWLRCPHVNGTAKQR